MGIHPIEEPESLSACDFCRCKLRTSRKIYFKLAAFFARELKNSLEGALRPEQSPKYIRLKAMRRRAAYFARAPRVWGVRTDFERYFIARCICACELCVVKKITNLSESRNLQ